jgi:hypothetical protein
MKVFGSKIGNSWNASSGKMLIKHNKWLNVKKKHLNRSKKHQNGLSEPMSDASKRLIVKEKL